MIMKQSKEFRVVREENAFTTQGWMRRRLGLVQNELTTYAIIYGATQTGNLTGDRLREAIAEWLGIHPKSVLHIINRLRQRHLVSEVRQRTIDGNEIRYYRIRATEMVANSGTNPKEQKAPAVEQLAPCAGDNKTCTIVNNINNNKMTPPTLEEVEAYCRERGNNVDAAYFCDYYQSKNWMVGKSPMSNWHAAVRTWERKDKRVGNTRRRQNIARSLNEIENA